MTENPIRAWEKWWVDRFETSTRSWSVAEVGVYIRLLNYSWIKRGIPDDEARLARICGCTEEEFTPLWRTVHQKWSAHPDRAGDLVQRFQEKVRAEQLGLHDKRVEAGKKGGYRKHEATRRANGPASNPVGSPATSPRVEDQDQGQGQDSDTNHHHQPHDQSDTRAPREEGHSLLEGATALLHFAETSDYLQARLPSLLTSLSSERWLGGWTYVECRDRINQALEQALRAPNQEVFMLAVIETSNAGQRVRAVAGGGGG